MREILLVVALLGLLPGAIGLTRLAASRPARTGRPGVISALVATLAFNLAFLWQEVWLAVPKAVVPGLTVTLYHNDHEWTGDAPVARVLQGTGAIANLVLGAAALAWLRREGAERPALRLLLFWFAFQGIYQSLAQLSFGALLPGNDVGVALAYLGTGPVGKAALLLFAVAAMAAAGFALARSMPAEVAGGGRTGDNLLLALTACVVLSVPFREPRDLVEVLLVPAAVNAIGGGWLLLGASLAGVPAASAPGEPISARWAVAALLSLLLVFQLVLRRGVVL